MTYNEMWRRLSPVYGEGEAKAIVRYVLDVGFGLSATDVYCGGAERLPAESALRLGGIIDRLAREEPVQYVLGEAEFAGRMFHVEPGVLIPRPETEELCGWAGGWLAGRGGRLSVLDAGTGSGCIAVTLALAVPQAEVTAWDVSPVALRVAGDNARRHGAGVRTVMQDMLCPPDDTRLWDAVVSNPPYICESERADMAQNVLAHEPAEALFVPDNDPLRFYRAVALYARRALKNGGSVFFEINPAYATDTENMLRGMGFAAVETRADQFGRARLTKAIKE